MAPFVEPVPASKWSGEAVDFVIVGGGIIGASTAYFLAKQNYRVAVIERSAVGAEQSSRNWGWCRTQGRDLREMPLILESMRLWRDIDREIGAATGFVTTGTLHVFPTERECANAHKWLEEARAYGSDCQFLTASEVARLVPAAPVHWQGALHGPTDGRAEPAMAAPAVMRAAINLGARLHTGVSVTGLDVAGGRIAGVVTPLGRIAAPQVIVAGGAWSSTLLRTLGVRLPQLPVIESASRTGKLDGGPNIGIKGGGFSIRKRADGGYTVGYGLTTTVEIVRDSFRYLGDFMPMLRSEWRSIRLRIGAGSLGSLRNGAPSGFGFRDGALNPAPIARDRRNAWRNLVKAFPQFANTGIIESWAGIIDVTPDLVPVISNVAEIPGLTVSTGYSGHGFGLGLGAGRLTAELATNAMPVVDPLPFRLNRF